MLRVRRIPLVAWLNFLGHQTGGTPSQRYTNLQVCFVATREIGIAIFHKKKLVYILKTSKNYRCSLPEPGSQHPTILV